MDMGQTQPIPPQSEPPALASPPPVRQPEKRKAPWVLIAVIVAIACLAIASGGGLFGYQIITTNATATGIKLGETATAENKATNTQVARVTGTANARSTATGVAIATRTARAEVSATALAGKTATADALHAIAPVPFSWKVAGYDTFDSNKFSWYDFPTETFDGGSYSTGLDDGILFIQAETNQPFYFYNLPSAIQSRKDMYASVEATLVSGDDSTRYGFLVRFNERTDDLYMVAFNGRGYWQVLRHQNDYWTYLRTGTSSAVNRTGTNTLATRIVGDQLTIYANGTEIAIMTDARIESGSVSVFMELTRYNVSARVEFDNFFVLSP